MPIQILIKLSILILLLGSTITQADVVKPSLIEINVNTNETVSIEIRTSIEALLTGINSQYKNTKESPNADKYDVLRKLSSDDLQKHFIPFHKEFLSKVAVKLDQAEIELKIDKVEIPLPGYTKVPRTSIIHLSGSIPRNTKLISWYYPKSFGDNAVRVRQIDKKNQNWHWSAWQWIRKDQFTKPFSLQEVFTQISTYEVIKTYLIAGFQHIIPKGFDHLLFIIGIFLYSSHLKPLFWQVTMFTLAHTITLGLASSGVILLASSIVEPLIALSIAYIAFENIISARRKVPLENKQHIRLSVIFLFGLLHGLGFASMLREFGLPDHAFFTALFSFNIGVEIAQLSVIAICYILLIKVIKSIIHNNTHTLLKYNHFIVIPFSIIIGCIGLFWTIERFDIEAIYEVYR